MSMSPFGMRHAFSHASMVGFKSAWGQGYSFVEEAAARETPQRTIMNAIAIHNNFRGESRITNSPDNTSGGPGMSITMSEKKFSYTVPGKTGNGKKCFVAGTRGGVPGYAIPFY